MKVALAAALIAFAAAAPHGAAPGAPRSTPIVVGSKPFIESEVLGELIAQTLEASGATVERRFDLGGTLICLGALRAGSIDVYPEYTGTGLVAILGADPPRDPLAALLLARRAFAERFDLVWLDPFGFENTYAIAVRRETARRLGLRALSDLVPAAPSLAVAVSDEFRRRDDGLPLLERRYGLAFGAVRSMSHELAYQALARGDVDALDAYTTDPELASGEVLCLEDDRRAFPPYHAAPLARSALLERPGVRRSLEALAGTVDVAAIRSLDAAVRDGAPVGDVVRRFRELSRGAASGAPAPPATGAWSAAARDVGRWTARHLALSAAALAAAALAGVPLGVLAARRPRAGAGVLGALGVIETVPSLALLGLLLPLVGIGVVPALVALFLYALLPIVRGTATGLHAVDPSVVEAVTALGLSPWQRLRAVELPLALGSLAGGVRTSAVLVVGTATLAAFIGAGGLGEPIFAGVRLARPALVLEGAVPAALLAVAADVALGLVERRLRRGRHLPTVR